MEPCYEKSINYLERYNKVISGASTFSKLNHFGGGKTPFALIKGKESFVWDVDGNKYIDYGSSRGQVILGYEYQEFKDSIINQLKDGIAFSLPHGLEIEVAEMICDIIPSAQMVRFGKNGNDVTSAAVRLARHVTNKEHILFCGYHGWQDWYIAQTTMNSGVPKILKSFTHRFNYNEIESLKDLFTKYNNNVAAVIMEPTRFDKPHCIGEKFCTKKECSVACQNNFLHDVKAITKENNALLIFDEVLIGFRLHKEGAQKYFGVIPDLTCIGKAMANGMPLSAVVGKEKYMNKFPQIYYSLTSAGEALSLAAAKFTLEIMDKIDICGHLNQVGGRLLNGIKNLIDKYELNDVMKIRGYPCLNNYFFVEKNKSQFTGTTLMDFWTQEIAKRGILTCETHFMNLSHTIETTEKTLGVYEDVIQLVKNLVVKGKV